MTRSSTFLISLVGAFLLVVVAPACAKDSYRSQGSKTGAKRGAASGAVAGAVGAMIFGGDVVGGAAAGAAMGSASGATSGAMAGGDADRRVEAQRQEGLAKQEAEIRELVGPDAYSALEALADCDHDEALKRAAAARSASNPNYQVAGLWTQVLTYADGGQMARAKGMLPAVVEADWEMKTEAQADAFLGELLNEMMDIREQYDLPRTCGAS